MRAPLPQTVCLLAACTFPGGSAVDPGARDGGGDPTDPDGALPPTRFLGDFETWPVPDNETEGGFHMPAAADGNQQWATLDLDGDGHLDLVQTADPVPSARRIFGYQTDAPYWRVYLGSELGFSSTPTTWPVPISATSTGFFAVGHGNLWRLLDLDGDGVLELVEMQDAEAGRAPWTDADGPHWRVFENTGAGFAPDYQRWSLPVPDTGTGFYGESVRTVDDGAWDVRDLDGDGLPDLIHTAPPGGPLVVWGADSSPHWKVYRNHGSGFEAAPEVWSLPEAEGWSRGFEWTERPGWRLLDLDRDGALELVQTRSLSAAEVFHDGSQPVWWVYEIGDGGFADEPALWPVPPTSMATGFLEIDRAEDAQHWQTLDLDGDGHLDLVHTANPSGELPVVWGSPDSDQWKLHRGTGAGFAPEVTSWRVPDSGLADGFYATAAAAESRYWFTVDLDRDGQVELVQTGDPGVPEGRVWGAGDGAPHWRVYRAGR